jgi:hypothetical protein
VSASTIPALLHGSSLAVIPWRTWARSLRDGPKTRVFRSANFAESSLRCAGAREPVRHHCHRTSRECVPGSSRSVQAARGTANSTLRREGPSCLKRYGASGETFAQDVCAPHGGAIRRHCWFLALINRALRTPSATRRTVPLARPWPPCPHQLKYSSALPGTASRHNGFPLRRCWSSGCRTMRARTGATTTPALRPRRTAALPHCR